MTEVSGGFTRNLRPRPIARMNPQLFRPLAVTKPAAIGIGVAALVVRYVAFKATKFALKLVMMLIALVALGLGAWFYWTAHHG